MKESAQHFMRTPPPKFAVCDVYSYLKPKKAPLSSLISMFRHITLTCHCQNIQILYIITIVIVNNLKISLARPLKFY